MFLYFFKFILDIIKKSFFFNLMRDEMKNLKKKIRSTKLNYVYGIYMISVVDNYYF